MGIKELERAKIRFRDAVKRQTDARLDANEARRVAEFSRKAAKEAGELQEVAAEQRLAPPTIAEQCSHSVHVHVTWEQRLAAEKELVQEMRIVEREVFGSSEESSEANIMYTLRRCTWRRCKEIDAKIEEMHWRRCKEIDEKIEEMHMEEGKKKLEERMMRLEKIKELKACLRMRLEKIKKLIVKDVYDQRSTQDPPKIHQRSTQDPPKIHQRSTQDPPKIHQRSTQDPPKIHQRSTQDPLKIHSVWVWFGCGLDAVWVRFGCGLDAVWMRFGF
jgi:hypothetical protein